MTTDTPSTIASRCLAIRNTTGMSIRAFGNFIDISFSLWVELEAGKREPGGAVLRALLARGFSADWLLAGVGTMLLGQPANMDESTHFRVMQLAADLNLAELATTRTITHLGCHERIGTCLQGHAEGLTYAELLHETGFEARQLKGFLKWLVDEGIVRQETGRYKLVEQRVRRVDSAAIKEVLIDVVHFLGQHLAKRLNRGEPDSKVASFHLNVPRGQEAETVKSLVAQLQTIARTFEQLDVAASTPLRIIFASSAEPR